MTVFSDLVGKTLVRFSKSKDDDEIFIEDSEGHVYRMYHRQECCEDVRVDDICGDIEDILNSPIIVAEESSNYAEPTKDIQVNCGYDASATWTFYKLDTIKGGIVVRWYGVSNGYYSESVDFEQVS